MDVGEIVNPYVALLEQERDALLDLNNELERQLDMSNEEVKAFKEQFANLKTKATKNLWQLAERQAQEDSEKFEQEGIHPDTLASQDVPDIDIKKSKSSSTIKRAR